MKKGDEKMTTALFCAIVAVTNTMGTVAVDTHGARVVSYVPVGGEEVFFAFVEKFVNTLAVWNSFSDGSRPQAEPSAEPPAVSSAAPTFLYDAGFMRV